ncbi:hypothetical protein LEP48_02200 [Isoptericola sp. NEAU-Y5]|uniref:Uncharacterized protein n=1 Tax=Isoptericola luteus TaxID=2879484 RepID=A0ABS7ZEG8_9MICO|nr:hypothetical protein [Isoptericola sp. NEAU-Y5]MCA5892160.1 hypothetical protein [Isoptericola sp. NEAU-Y5]
MPDDELPGATPHLHLGRVLRVRETTCDVWHDGAVTSVAFAPMFPSPRTERVSPGHLVAVATGGDGRGVVVWRWYDAVVLGEESDGSVHLWEPAHGEVVAAPRAGYRPQEPGARAYASAGLPGADWWVAEAVSPSGSEPTADVDEVEAFYTRHGLWSAALG